MEIDIKFSDNFGASSKNIGHTKFKVELPRTEWIPQYF